MPRTASRKRRTTAAPRTTAAKAPTLDEKHQRMIEAGASVGDRWATRVVFASADRWVPRSDGALGSNTVEVELMFTDGATPEDGCNISVHKDRYPEGLHERNIHIPSGLLVDEIELFALALTEAVRLGKERGIIGAGGAK